MADKRISDLVAATGVNPSDLFVLEQSGTAKKLTGQILETWLLQLAQGHGGITGIQKVGTSVLVDTYRITFSDATTFDFTVSNGRGITNITWTTSGTSGNGQLHKGTITYNDGTTQTINIRDGYKGNPGADGASAYQQAVAGGYSGTEAQFNDALANFEDYYTQTIENKNAAVTAAGQASASASSAQASMGESQNYANQSATSAAQSEQSARNSASNAAASIGSYYRKEVAGEYVHFTDGADNVPMVSVKVDLQPRLETNGYDSVWPAGGGNNIAGVDDQIVSGDEYVVADLGYLPAGDYYFSFDAVNNSGEDGRIYLFYRPAELGVTVVPNGANGRINSTIAATIPDSTKKVILYTDGDFSISNFMLSTVEAAPYEPYENKGWIPPWQTFTENVSKTWAGVDQLPPGVVQYSVDLTAAGLFYGGTVDIPNGATIAEFASKTFLGTEGWAIFTGNTYYLNLTEGPFGDVSVQFDGQNLANYLTWAESATWDGKNIVRFDESTSRRLYVINPTFASSLAEFMAYLSSNPLQICYKVETPTSASFQGQQINSFLGENYVWATLGSHAIGTTSVVYRVDMTTQFDALEASVAEQAQIATEAAESVSASAAQIETNRQDIAALKENALKPYPIGKASGAVASFADGVDYILVKSLVIEVEPKQDETPSADNIVPIEGYTSFSCTRVGKNFANPEYIYNTSGASNRYDSDKGTLTVSGSQQYSASYFSIKAKKGVKYTFSAYAEDFEGEDSNARLGIRRGTATQLVASTTSITTPGWLSISYTAVANENLRFTLFTGYAHSGRKETTYSHIQIEIATSRTPYEKFEENQIFEPSLVDALYGGALDLTNGVLTKTWENIASYAGESLPGRWLSDRDVYTEGVTPTTGAQVVYELESPVVTDGLTTYEVKTLYGYNNILCRDADNASIEVEYRADPTLYIEKKLSAVKAIIAGVESDYTATQNYVIGDFIVAGDGLYRVTAAIASGETIDPGTNCTETTVAEQLKALYTLVNS